MGAPAMVELVDIRKSFPVGPVNVEVLKGVDLRIDRGDLAAVVGESGSGKSTLMSILGLLDSPTSGSYRLDGQEVARLDDNAVSGLRNRRLGFVFQSFQLLPRLDALHNVAEPMIYGGTPDEEALSRARELLGQVGLADRAGYRPSQLSGGQQQRVAIARALVNRPSLLLADEPTGALDPRVGRDILEAFLDLNRKQGITVVMITHDPKVAAACDRVFEMRDGRLGREERGRDYGAAHRAGSQPASARGRHAEP